MLSSNFARTEAARKERHTGSSKGKGRAEGRKKKCFFFPFLQAERAYILQVKGVSGSSADPGGLSKRKEILAVAEQFEQFTYCLGLTS